MEKLLRISHFILEAPFFSFSRNNKKIDCSYRNGISRKLRVISETQNKALEQDLFLSLLYFFQNGKQSCSFGEICQLLGKKTRRYSAKIRNSLLILSETKYSLENILGKESKTPKFCLLSSLEIKNKVKQILLVFLSPKKSPILTIKILI